MNKHLKIFVLTIIMLIHSIGIIYSQTELYKFRHLTVKDGLSSNQINAILKDSDGFMWFGTGDGLVRFDGYNYKTYYLNPGDSSSYPNNNIKSLIEDKKGNLWIGTSKTGLYRFNRKTETYCNFQHDPLDSFSISQNYVNIIYQDNDNRIWIGTNDCGLNMFDPDSEKFITYKCNLNVSDGNNILSIYEDRSGIFWIGTKGGIFRFDRQNNQFHPFNLGYEIPEVKRDIICIMEDNLSGNLWFGSRWGLFKFNPVVNEITHFFYDPQKSWKKQLTNINIFSIVETSENGNQIFWIATGFGIEKFNVNNETFSKIYNDPNNNRSISSSKVISLFYDESGMLWMGTLNGGVNILNLRQQNFKHYNQIDNTYNNFRPSASCFCVDGENNIWVGTSVDGIIKLDSNFNTILNQQIYTFDSNEILSFFRY